jgi:endonuclease/exonuclease/phosphatase family metal-dependent hydrolase
MSVNPEVRMKSVSWSEIVLPALSLIFGLQIMRTLWPYLRYAAYLRPDIGPLLTGLVVLVVLSFAFSTAWLHRRLGLRCLLVLSAGGLGLSRLAMQVWSGDPLGDLLSAFIGTVCFILFLPAYLAVVRINQANRAQAAVRFAGGILLGLALDTALHGAFLTYDFIWQPGTIPLLLATMLVVAQGAALYLLLPTVPVTARDGTFSGTWPWLAIGPYLALQMLVLQNLGRFAVLTGWSLPPAFTWVLLSQLIGLWIAMVWQPRSLLGVGGMGVILIGTLSFIETTHPLTQAIMLCGSQVVSAVLITTILRRTSETVSEPGLKYTSLIHGLGIVLMITLMAGSYVDNILPSRILPSSSVWLFNIAGVIIVLSVAKTVTFSPSQTKRVASWLAPTLALPLLFLPAFVWLTWRTPSSITPETGSIRVMTYNVHNGFNTKGHLDLEAQVQVMEAQRPDVIALQEVSRGELIHGSVDMFSWLSQRLGLPHVYTPAGDGLWGQAIFSRYPILLAETHPLPPLDLPLKRSFGYFQIDMGRAKPLNLINTHYYPRRRDKIIQPTHTAAILKFLADRSPDQFIITGDFNAEPYTPQMQSFFERGLIDVIASAGITPGYTATSENPVDRIDYILISPDLTVTNVVIPSSTASDHLPVAATIEQN